VDVRYHAQSRPRTIANPWTGGGRRPDLTDSNSGLPRFPMAMAVTTSRSTLGGREGAKVAVGETPEFSIAPSTGTVNVTIPPDLSGALKKSAKACAQWKAITPKARSESVSSVTSAKKEETRAGRVANRTVGLAKGEKRPFYEIRATLVPARGKHCVSWRWHWRRALLIAPQYLI
jgi:hypothetical protein